MADFWIGWASGGNTLHQWDDISISSTSRGGATRSEGRGSVEGACPSHDEMCAARLNVPREVVGCRCASRQRGVTNGGWWGDTHSRSSES